jgi:predicted RNase H-like HicB family nuclease
MCPDPGGPKLSQITVVAARDEEAGVWYVESSNLPGLHTEADTFDALKAKLPGLVEDLIELNRVDLHGEVKIEVIARDHALAHVP